MNQLPSKKIRTYHIKMGKNTCVFDDIPSFYEELKILSEENPLENWQISTKLMEETDYEQLPEHDGF